MKTFCHSKKYSNNNNFNVQKAIANNSHSQYTVMLTYLWKVERLNNRVLIIRDISCQTYVDGYNSLKYFSQDKSKDVYVANTNHTSLFRFFLPRSFASCLFLTTLFFVNVARSSPNLQSSESSCWTDWNRN